MNNRYPESYRNNVPREFYKSIKHNGKIYTLHSIYDENDFDSQVRDFLSKRENRKRINKKMLNRKHFNFDQNIYAYQLSDDLQQIYDTDLFD